MSTAAERAMIHAMSGSLLQGIGERRQAEVEYLTALELWTSVGRGQTAEAGAALTALGTLYVQERRFEEAGRSVDRASAIFAQISDATPMDRSKLIAVRATLHAGLGGWPSAKKDFFEALSLADRQPGVDPTYVLNLLNRLAVAMRKNHHRHEARAIEARAASLLRGTSAEHGNRRVRSGCPSETRKKTGALTYRWSRAPEA